ncbi:3-oxoacyl-[acyl-carrier-protein] synthase III [Renibacterium salmoninarum ATCC 33209]|uniref:3-oxoacyl-[acyl-carrier-protein] synthase III n=1 Tax=Renibacterium salmoninarum (strain ATCC 33209 / DSM 20767 / JCM 11484 / NBRC 15589 / NCIMB 2235) TaxID=288705 RepID=A9WLQ9_RENSM|nr:3-oxoacyl-[acyl-carrier-protein] synthase III [Renibacterium salmoninarum ATCC 33209]
MHPHVLAISGYRPPGVVFNEKLSAGIQVEARLDKAANRN